jgi:hypothetical protein
MGKSIATAVSIGKQLCEALGLEAQRVRAITLHVESGNVVSVTVERFITNTQGLAVAEILRQKFKLAECVETEVLPLAPVKPEDSEPGPAHP